MLKNNKKELQHVAIISALICVTLIIRLVVINDWTGHDFTFHLLRLGGLSDAIADGVAFPVRIYNLYLCDHGYGLGLFYPDLFLYPFALLNVLGMDLLISFYAMLVVFFTLCGVTSYIAGRVITKNHFASIIIMIAYTFCQYHFANMFPRTAVGELQAMVFIPLIFAGLWNFTEQKFSKPWIITLGFIGLMYCHTLSVAISAAFSIVWALIRIKKVIKIEKWFSKALICLVYFLALTSMQWMVMVEALLSDKFMYSLNFIRTLYNTHNYVSFFNNTFFIGLGISGKFMFISIPLIMLVKFILRKKFNVPSFVFFASASFLFALTFFKPFWRVFDKLSPVNIQFPWRLNQVAFLFLSIALGLLVAEISKKGIKALIIVGLCLASIANLFFLSMWCDRGVVEYNYYEDKSLTSIISTGEWLPLSKVDILSEMVNKPNGEYETPSDNKLIGEYLQDGSFSFEYTGETGEYSVPLLYYKGYSAMAVDENGNKVEIQTYKSNNAMVTFNIDESISNSNIIVYYKGTLIQKISLFITAMTVILTLAYVIFKKIKKQNS